jgi:hypothetical protein
MVQLVRQPADERALEEKKVALEVFLFCLSFQAGPKENETKTRILSVSEL